MSRSIWGTLGIAPTTDKAEIRRAYAKALKRTNPEDDAAGFQALRAAYEQALGMAEQRLTAAPRQGRRRRAGPAADSAREVIHNEQAPTREQEEHAAACRRLHAWVSAPGGDPADGLARLAAVLDSAAMETIGVYVQTEGWLGRLILEHVPRSDVLLEAAIERFGWGQRARESTSPLIEGLRARHEALKAIKLWGSPRHPQNDAFTALTRPPRGRRLWRNRLTVGLAGRVQQLLQDIEEQVPSALVNLDQEALVWWRKYASKPRFGPGWIWFILIAPPLLAWSFIEPSGLFTSAFWPAYLPALALCAGAGAGWVFAVLRPRQAWRERWRWKAAGWLRYGWAGGAVVTLVAAALIPASALTGVAVAALGAVFAYWAMVVGEPDRRRLGHPWELPEYISLITMAFWILQVFWRPNVRLPWLMRAVASFAYLGLFWLLARELMTEAVWWQMTMAVAPAAFAFAAGAETLAEGWARLQPRVRRGALMLAVATMGMTWFVWLMCTSPSTRANPATYLVAAALTIVLHLAHRIPAYAQTGALGVARDVAMRYGWIAWFIFPARQIFPDAAMMVLAGYWVMGGAAVAIAGALYAEYDLRLPDRGRKRRLAWYERIN